MQLQRLHSEVYLHRICLLHCCAPQHRCCLLIGMLTGLLSWLLTGQLREHGLPDRFALIVRQRLETLKQVHHSILWLLMVLLLLFLRKLRSACCVGLPRSFIGSSCSCTILIHVSAIYISCNKLSRMRRIGAGNWLHGESDD
jgi:hypothetical protein